MEYTQLTPDEVAELDGLDDWQVVGTSIHGSFRGPTFPAGATLIGEIADAAEAAGHHPDIDLRYPGVVHVVLTTHATDGLTDADVDLARTVSALAREAEVDAAEPCDCQ